MSGQLTNVRPIRPMRILLVTDDARYADRVVAAAALTGAAVALASGDDDLDAIALRDAPNVVVLDADDTLGRTARIATVFAALHPRIAVVLVANKPQAQGGSSLRVVDKWRSGERLLDELEIAYLGLVAPSDTHSSAGD